MRLALSLLLSVAVVLPQPVRAAINLASLSDGRVSFGDLAPLNGLSAMTIALTFKPTAAFSDNQRLVTQWGSGNPDNAFLVAITDTDEITTLLSDGAGNYGGRKTTSVNLAVSTQYRLAITYAFGSPVTFGFWVNGSSVASTDDIGTINLSGLINSSDSLIVGHEPPEGLDGPDGDYSEFAIWTRVLTSGELAAVTTTLPPSCYPSDGFVYLPMADTTDLTDDFSMITASLTDGSNATHPSLSACGGGGTPAFGSLGLLGVGR